MFAHVRRAGILSNNHLLTPGHLTTQMFAPRRVQPYRNVRRYLNDLTLQSLHYQLIRPSNALDSR